MRNLVRLAVLLLLITCPKGIAVAPPASLRFVLDRLLLEYRTHGLPLPPRGAQLVRYCSLEEYLLNPDGVAVVEWWERIASPQGGGEVSSIELKDGHWPTIRIRIETIGESARRILYDDSWT